jgi:hypothetical protein
LTTRANDSQNGATIKTVGDYFRAQLSDPNTTARADLLNTIREQNVAAQSRNVPNDLPGFFLKDDGAGDKFPQMKEGASRRDGMDELGAAKGRRREAEPIAAAPQEIARPMEVAQAPQAPAQREFDVIRL